MVRRRPAAPGHPPIGKNPAPGGSRSRKSSIEVSAAAFHVQSPARGATRERMKIAGIIPARYASTRFPGKPLALICGKSLLQRVVERCQQAKSLSEVVVATDDARIAEVARKFCRVEMTREDHPSGSDRIARSEER